MISVVDLGNYEQCLNINSNNGDIHIEGKYYLIRVPLVQELTLPVDLPYNLSLTTGNREKGDIRVKALLNGIQEFVIRNEADG